MLILKIHSKDGWQDKIKRIDQEEALIIDCSLVGSIEEVQLAEILAQRSFEQKKNIGKQFKYEFLLWLTAKRDIKSALEIARPKGEELFLIIFEGDKKEILRKLGVKEIRFRLKKSAAPFELEKISLSRVL